MPRGVERTVEPIELRPILDGSWIELRIKGEVPQGDRLTHLSVLEARLLAYELLAAADEAAARTKV